MARGLLKGKKLGKLPSDLILDSLDDVRYLEKQKQFIIDMGTWVSPVDRYGTRLDFYTRDAIKITGKRLAAKRRLAKKCEVCEAGATIVCRLNSDIKSCFEPGDFSPKVQAKLEAINELREGRVYQAFNRLGLLNEFDALDPQVPPIVAIPRYDTDRPGFFAELTRLAITLQTAGY